MKSKTKNVKVFEDTHKKLKIHVAKSGDKLTDFVSLTLEKEMKNAKKKEN